MSPAQFVAQLAAYAPTETLFNPYHVVNPHHQLCQKNLLAYLERMTNFPPTLCLIGEALGYKGGRLTGIPFTSERILADRPDLFAPDLFQLRHPEKPTSEQTATIMWQSLQNLTQASFKPTQSGRPPLPLLWNAFPFHPHHPGRPLSNRAPTLAEIKSAAHFIEALRTLFPMARLVAVGQKGSKSLTMLDLDHVAIRHPARGGKADFIKGLSLHL